MFTLRNLFCLTAVAVVAAALLIGCSGNNAVQPTSGGPASDIWQAGLDEDAVTALSQLSNKERTAALTQKVCPVTDEPLGSMGKPPKVTVEGREVFLCCDGCKEELRKDPAKYLAKLKTN